MKFELVLSTQISLMIRNDGMRLTQSVPTFCLMFFCLPTHKAKTSSLWFASKAFFRLLIQFEWPKPTKSLHEFWVFRLKARNKFSFLVCRFGFEQQRQILMKKLEIQMTINKQTHWKTFVDWDSMSCKTLAVSLTIQSNTFQPACWLCTCCFCLAFHPI